MLLALALVYPVNIPKYTYTFSKSFLMFKGKYNSESI